MTEPVPPGEGAGAGKDPLARFRSWRGFLLAAVVVNVLFIYGMLGNAGDARLETWYKSLIWLPFNVIATVLYYVFPAKLAKEAEEAAATGRYTVRPWSRYFYVAVSVIMIALDWIVMFSV